VRQVTTKASGPSRPAQLLIVPVRVNPVAVGVVVAVVVMAPAAEGAENLGKPIGSINRGRPFGDALRSGDPHRLRAVADKMVEKALGGDMQVIREVADRMDGKPAQAIERADDRLVVMLSDTELLMIAAGIK